MTLIGCLGSPQKRWRKRTLSRKLSRCQKTCWVCVVTTCLCPDSPNRCRPSEKLLISVMFSLQASAFPTLFSTPKLRQPVTRQTHSMPRNSHNNSNANFSWLFSKSKSTQLSEKRPQSKQNLRFNRFLSGTAFKTAWSVWWLKTACTEKPSTKSTTPSDYIRGHADDLQLLKLLSNCFGLI